MLQCVAVCCRDISILQVHILKSQRVSVLQCDASVMQCLCCSVLQCMVAASQFCRYTYSTVSLLLKFSCHVTIELTFSACCNVLQCVAVCCSAFHASQCVAVCCSVLQCIAVCYSVLQCVTMCYSVLQCVAVRCSVLQCVAVCCSVLQCVAVCCSVLQCVAGVAVCCSDCTDSWPAHVCMRLMCEHNSFMRCNTLQHTATLYNTSQCTATHCNALQHTCTDDTSRSYVDSSCIRRQ